MALGTGRNHADFLHRQAAMGRLSTPTAFVLLASLGFLAQTYAVRLRLGDDFLQVIDPLIVWGLYRVVEPFLLWGYFTAAIFAGAILFGGRPLLGHVIRVVAWGFPPIIVGSVFWTAGQYYALANASLEGPDLLGMEHDWAQLNDFLAQTHGDPVLVGATVLGCCCLGVSAYVWTIGATRACDLDRRRMAVVVAVPTVVYVGWRIGAVFGVFPGP